VNNDQKDRINAADRQMKFGDVKYYLRGIYSVVLHDELTSL